MLVCRHWREVVLASRKLWCTFNPNRRSKVKWTDLCLLRSAQAPLHVHCEAPSSQFDFLNSHLHRLSPNTNRISRLCLWWQDRYSPLALLIDGLPALEVLKLSLEPSGDHPHQPLEEDQVDDLSLTHRQFPRLLDLTLIGMTVPSDVPLFTNLRRLSLRHCSAKFSLCHFLDALAVTEALEILELSGVLQHLSDRPQTTPSPPRQPLGLPRLMKLIMAKHSPSLTLQFLSHLITPPTTSLYVYSLLADVREDEVQETIVAILPPRPSTALPVLAQVADVEVTVHGQTYGLRGGLQKGAESYSDYSSLHLSGPYAEPEVPDSHLVTLSICSPAFEIWERSLPKALNDLLHVFAFATLTTLKIVADCQQADAPTWERVFLHLPHLASFALSVPLFPDLYGEYASTGTLGEADTVFNGLLAASRARSANAPGGPADSEVEPQMACPGLRVVSVVMDGILSPQLLDSVVACFRFRAERDARLERLAVEQRSDIRLAPALRRSYVSQLLEVVGNLSFSMAVGGRRRDYVDASGPAPGLYLSDDFVSDDSESDEVSDGSGADGDDVGDDASDWEY